MGSGAEGREERLGFGSGRVLGEVGDGERSRRDWGLEKVYLTPSTIILGLLHPLNYETVCFTP